MPTVIGVDPGQTTGYAVLSVPTEALLGIKTQDLGKRRVSLHEQVTVHYTGQIDCTPPWENRGAQNIAELLLISKPDAVFAIEDFILDFNRADKGRHTLSPVRVIAKLEMTLWKDQYFHGINIDNRLNFQSASLAKTTCTDERLKEWGLYDRTSGVHARDAMRHAYYFLRGCRGDSVKAAEKRWHAWPTLYADPVILELGKAYPKSKPINIRKREPGERIPGL